MYRLLLCLIFSGLNFKGQAAVSWVQRADFGGSGRHRACALSIGNKGYLGLGHINGTGVETYFSDWWEYDPATNAWTQKADYIGNNGNGELGARTISLETVGYVGLGELDVGSLYKYDPVTNSWTEVTSPPSINVFRDTQEMQHGHKAYFTDLLEDELYEYDCDLDQWTYLGHLPLTWGFVFSAFTLNDKIYVKAYDQMWMYDPALNSWQLKNVFPGAASQASNYFVQHGKAYVVNGHTSVTGSDVVSEVWCYDPDLNSWSQLEDFSGTSRRYGTQFTIGDRCFISTGTNGTNFSDLWEFDAIAGLDESELSEFKIGPIPAKDKVTISSGTIDTYEIQLFNSLGKVLHEAGTTNGELHVERANLASGNYFYRIYSGSKTLDTGIIILADE